MTNEERIRKLPRWDLAEFIKDVSDNEIKISVCENECAKCEFTEDYCTFQIAEWLMQESE